MFQYGLLRIYLLRPPAEDLNLAWWYQCRRYADEHTLVEYARQHTDDIDITMHAKRSLLFNHDQAWVKNDDSGFDVTMGSYDGAEVCERSLHFRPARADTRQEKRRFVQRWWTEYPAVERHPRTGCRPPAKKIIKTFERLGLRITIEVNRKAVDYLDITMNLSDGTHRSTVKPN